MSVCPGLLFVFAGWLRADKGMPFKSRLQVPRCREDERDFVAHRRIGFTSVGDYVGLERLFLPFDVS